MKKLTCLKIFRPVPLWLFLLIAVSVWGGSQYSPAAAQAPQGREFYSRMMYRFAAGSSLYSADSTMREHYQAAGCVSVLDTALQFLTIGLQLPDGAIIDFLRVYYYDSDGIHDGTANIRKYDGMGGTIEIASVSSAGAAGYGTALSPYVGHVVDNLSGGYVLNWVPGATGPTIQLCGLRVAYRLPLTPTFLPLVFR